MSERKKHTFFVVEPLIEHHIEFQQHQHSQICSVNKIVDSNHKWNNYLLHMSSHTNSSALENFMTITAHGDELQPQILNAHTSKGIQGSQH